MKAYEFGDNDDRIYVFDDGDVSLLIDSDCIIEATTDVTQWKMVNNGHYLRATDPRRATEWIAANGLTLVPDAENPWGGTE